MFTRYPSLSDFKVRNCYMRKASRTRSSLVTRKSTGKTNKYVFAFGNKTEGNAGMRELLGGKGANLAEMASIGLPVLQGSQSVPKFVPTTTTMKNVTPPP